MNAVIRPLQPGDRTVELQPDGATQMAAEQAALNIILGRILPQGTASVSVELKVRYQALMEIGNATIGFPGG